MEKNYQKRNPPVRPRHPGELGEGVLTHGSSVSPFPAGIQVQAQLETTAPGDALEREADSMADTVLQKIETGSLGAVLSPSFSTRPSISASGGSSVSISSHMESRLLSSQGGGHALPGQLRSQMEGAFGQGFSDVRIHADSSAAELNRSIGAKAFTYGNDIYFNAGQYRPETADGMHLLAHELTHTVQQSDKVARETDSPVEPETANSELFMLQLNARIMKVKGAISTLKGMVEAQKTITNTLNQCEKVWKQYDVAVRKVLNGPPGKVSALSWAAYLFGLFSLADKAWDARNISTFATVYYCYYFSLSTSSGSNDPLCRSRT